MTAARLTPAGRGAVAVIEVVGPINVAEWPFRPANERPWLEQSIDQLLYGRWTEEDVVACRVNEDRCEIHCHGGDAAVNRIVDDLTRLGHATAAAHSIPHELKAALSQALTARTADLLNEQCRLWQCAGELSPTQVEAMRTWSEFGRHLTQPWKVVLTGRTNVGKSSLINALLGYERAIVTAEPGTTRDVVTAVTAFDGWPVQLSDTAGQRATASDLEAAGIDRARSALRSADLRIVVLDVSELPTDADLVLLDEWPAAIVVANKCDQSDCWGAALPAEALRVSSRTGSGLAELQRELARRLVPEVPPPGTLIPVTLQQRARVNGEKA
jgi:tRNA modification GTPase